MLSQLSMIEATHKKRGKGKQVISIHRAINIGVR